MIYDFERELGIEERLEHQGNPKRREDRHEVIELDPEIREAILPSEY